MIAASDLSGTVLKERYRLQSLLGQSMGSVYAALDLRTDRPVVVKTAGTTEEMARLVAERETLVRLSHPGVVRCLDFWSEAERVVMVLERLEGRSLLEELEESPGRLPEAKLVDWGVQMARTLVYLHGQRPPVIHRDLKPQHAFLGTDGRVRLLDFGIARVKRGEARDTEHLGTPGYAAPEQYGLYGRESDERTDVYGLGATLFHLATRKTVDQVREPRVREYHPGLSPRLASVIERAVSGDPGRRYPTAEALLEDLEACRAVPATAGPAAWLGGAVLAGGAVWLGTDLGAAGQGWEGAVSATCLAALAAGGALALRGRPAGVRAAGAALATAGGLTLAACLNPQVPAEAAAWFRRLGLSGAPLLLAVPALGWILAAGWLAAAAWSASQWRRTGARVAGLRLALLVGVLNLVLVGTAQVARSRDTVPVAPPGAHGTVLWEAAVPPFSRIFEVPGGRGPGEAALVFTDDMRLQAFGLRSGKELWEHPVAGPDDYWLLPNPILVREGQVLLGLDALSGAAGSPVPLEAPLRSLLPADSSTLVVDPESEADPRWIGIDWPSGRVLWRRAHEGLLRGAWEGHALADAGEGRYTVVEARTGRPLWSVDVGPGRGTYRPLATHGLLLWVGDGGIRAFALADGKERYRLDPPAPAGTGPTAGPWIGFDRQRVVVGSGDGVVCFRPGDGQVAWRADLGLERIAGLRAHPDVVLVQTASGRLLGLSPDDGSLLWEHWPRDREGTRTVAPSALDRKVPLFTERNLVLYPVPGEAEAVLLQADTGDVLARIDLGPGATLRTAQILPGRILMGLTCEDGTARLRCVQTPEDPALQGSLRRPGLD